MWLPSHIWPPIFSKVQSGFHNAPGGGIGWFVVGGESGPGARPMHPRWAQSLRDQCVEAGVPFLFKQWGDWAPHGPETVQRELVETPNERNTVSCGRVMFRVGKIVAGRRLDGQFWDQYPTAVTP